MSVRPSEQRRKTSPGSASTVKVSTSTSGSVPTARVITERCGCVSASSGDSFPLRMSSPTSEWSFVSCSRLPPRTRYARESPTWPIRTAPSRPVTATVIVVPMPDADGSSCERLKTRRFASWISSTMRSSRNSSPLASSSTAAASPDATSPACAPPIPSATAKSGGSQT